MSRVAEPKETIQINNITYRVDRVDYRGVDLHIDKSYTDYLQVKGLKVRIQVAYGVGKDVDREYEPGTTIYGWILGWKDGMQRKKKSVTIYTKDEFITYIESKREITDEDIEEVMGLLASLNKPFERITLKQTEQHTIEMHETTDIERAKLKMVGQWVDENTIWNEEDEQ